MWKLSVSRFLDEGLFCCRYYDGGLSSVYLWDTDTGFAGAILVKKSVNDEESKVKGCWDSINVIEVQEKTGGKSAHYKLTTTIMLWLQVSCPTVFTD